MCDLLRRNLVDAYDYDVFNSGYHAFQLQGFTGRLLKLSKPEQSEAKVSPYVDGYSGRNRLGANDQQAILPFEA